MTTLKPSPLQGVRLDASLGLREWVEACLMAHDMVASKGERGLLYFFAWDGSIESLVDYDPSLKSEEILSRLLQPEVRLVHPMLEAHFEGRFPARRHVTHNSNLDE